MPVTLEWVRMPSGVYFRTICHNGIPLPEPTRYLLTHVHPDVSPPNTVRTYAQWLLPFFKWLDQVGLALTDITRMDIKRFHDDLLSRDTVTSPILRKGANSAPSTICDAVATAIRFLLWAMGPDDTVPLIRRGQARYLYNRRRVTLSRLSGEDYTSLKNLLPHLKRDLPKHLTQSQLDTCRAWIMEAYSFDKQLQLRNRAIFEVLWDGALRRGSLLGLCSENIDWLERTIQVSFDKQAYRDAWYSKIPNYRTAKSGEHNVVVADQTIQWLDRYRQEARPVEAIRLCHGIYFCEHAPFGKDHGQPLSLETLLYLFEAMSKPKSAGGSGIYVTPHMLRHTWATMAEEDGLAPETIQFQLGHASIVTTQNYMHVAPEKVREDLTKWRSKSQWRYTGPTAQENSSAAMAEL